MMPCIYIPIGCTVAPQITFFLQMRLQLWSSIVEPISQCGLWPIGMDSMVQNTEISPPEEETAPGYKISAVNQ